MKESIICAGFGGQGIMLMGRVLAHAAMEEDKYVTWIPSYGAEVRGGTAYCFVIISDQPIASPYISYADSAIIMNEPSLVKFLNRIKTKGLVLINSSLVRKSPKRDNVRIIEKTFTEIAQDICGDAKVANMVAIGTFIRQKRVACLDSLFKAIDAIFIGSDALCKLNKKAIWEGTKLS